MKRVLFVCHGNICRSPMAEFIARNLAQKAGLSDVEFDSKATTRDEINASGIGHDTDRRTKSKLDEKGIPYTYHEASQVTREDYQKYDYLFCMDEENFLDLNRITGGDPDGKEKKLLTLLGSHKDIDDPWFTGDFETSYRQIKQACEVLIENLKNE